MREASTETKLKFMSVALNEAHKAFDKNEVPIGAILVKDDVILARAHNLCESKSNPLKHAELQVIEKATTKLGNWRLNDCTLYVTLEPCPMCLGALFQARLGKVVFGCEDHKRARQQSSESVFLSLSNRSSLIDNNHKLQIEGAVCRDECAKLLKDFFKARRKSS